MKASDIKDGEQYEIGNVGNYYGGLHVKKDGDVYFWSVEDWDGHSWHPISKRLFETLIEEEFGKEKESITGLYLEGLPIDEIASAHNVEVDYVENVIKGAGLK